MSRFPRDLSSIIPFTIRGITHSVDLMVQGIFPGMLLFLALIGFVLLLGKESYREREILLSMIAGVVSFYLINAYGRSSLSIEQAVASRYTYIASAFLIPVLVFAASVLCKKSAALRPLLAALFAIAIVGNVSAYYEYQIEHRKLINHAVVRVGAAIPYAQFDYLNYDTQIEPLFSPDITIGGLSELIDRGLLTEKQNISEWDQLLAASQFGVAVLEPADSLVQRLPDNLAVVVAPGFDLIFKDSCVELYPAGGILTVEFETPEEGSLVQVASHSTMAHYAIRSESGMQTGFVEVLTQGEKVLGLWPQFGKVIVQVEGSGYVELCNVSS
jgi:hypothetical protein